MQAPAVDGYEAICEPPHIYYVLPEWKGVILEDLRGNFAKVHVGDRVVHPDGRAGHFAYRPSGSEGRLLVRRAFRAGVAKVLRDLHVGSGRGVRELKVCAEAKRLGIQVPEIVAARITKVWPFFYRFTFVVREIPGARNFMRLARDAGPKEKREAIGHLAAALRRMHESGMYHGDLTVGNVLLSEDGKGPQVHFIDLDRARLIGDRDPKCDEANIERSEGKILACIRILTDLREAWEQVATQAEVAVADESPAPARYSA